MIVPAHKFQAALLFYNTPPRTRITRIFAMKKRQLTSILALRFQHNSKIICQD